MQTLACEHGFSGVQKFHIEIHKSPAVVVTGAHVSAPEEVGEPPLQRLHFCKNLKLKLDMLPPCFFFLSYPHPPTSTPPASGTACWLSSYAMDTYVLFIDHTESVWTCVYVEEEEGSTVQ